MTIYLLISAGVRKCQTVLEAFRIRENVVHVGLSALQDSFQTDSASILMATSMCDLLHKRWLTATMRIMGVQVVTW